ncbi:MAG: MBL fold metallo-hydrolase [Flavobacteriia bacterium]|nr:MBL fold metallo-hydrolase [Flavobacteriia bacterium]
MKITFLGTGTSQGIPVIGSQHPVCMSKNPKDKRLRSSVLIQWDDYNYVIDCGPDFRQQMLSVDCQYLSGILFSHEHADHTAGIDDIRPFFFRQGDIPIYASMRVVKELTRRFGYIFETDNKYPGTPAVKINTIAENTPFSLGEKMVIPIEVMHNRLPVMGFRIDNFSYLTDVKYIEDQQLKKLEGTEVLVINALRKEPHPTHLNLEEALEIVQHIKPKAAYFTHISHLLGFHDEVSKELPQQIYLAYDGLQIQIN